MLERIGRKEGTGTAIYQLATVAILRDGSDRQRLPLPHMLPLGANSPSFGTGVTPSGSTYKVF